MSHPGQEHSGFVWLGGRPSLDFCNTRLGDQDLLVVRADLARWFTAAGLTDQEPQVSAEELEGSRCLREGLRNCLTNDECGALAGLAETWLVDAPGHLCVEANTLRPRFIPTKASARCLLVPVVLDALELARDEPGRVRECAGPECPVLFEDTSRNHSRRWCSMEACGARSKSAAYYRRSRGRCGDPPEST